MRVTLLAVGSRGDVQPLIALALGLESAGHQVRLATHSRFQESVSGRGLEFAPLAEGHLSQGAETAAGRRWIESGSKRLPTWVGFVRDARSVASRRLVDAVAACEGAEAIVAGNMAFVLGWQIAADRRLPLMRAFLEPPAWMLTKRPTRRLAPALRQVAWLGARPWLNRIRRTSLGLGPLPRREPFAGLDRHGMPAVYAFSPAVLAGSPALNHIGETTGYWFLDQTSDPEPPAALEEFLASGPPPVAIGFSTMIDDDPAARTRLVLDALRRAGVRGLIQASAAELGGASLPPDVFAVGNIAHQWLFPRCAAVVHHAAVGTTAAALRAGVPAVPVPHMTDQFFWGRRLYELGVSPAPIPRRELTAERLADGIRRAAGDDDMRRRAGALGATIAAENGVARAVQAFERDVVRPSQPRPREPFGPVSIGN